MVDSSALAYLYLQQISDSAFPIGGQAHSFGLETLVSDGSVTAQNLERFLIDYLNESALVDGWFCRQAYQAARLFDNQDSLHQWLKLNQQLSAYRTARESRVASAALGRRFLTHLQSLVDNTRLANAYQINRSTGVDSHYATSFGFVSGLLGLGEEESALFFLQQSIQSLLTASQKLMAIGQSQTIAILWRIKPELLAALARSKSWSQEDGFSSFGLMLEIAAMRHATLPVRLFIS